MKSKSKLSREQRATAARLAIASAPVARYNAPQGRENLKSFTAEYDAQQAADEQARKDEVERPIRKAQEEHSRLLRELIDADLLAGLDTESQFLAATAPSIGTGDQFIGQSPETIRATCRKALSEAEDNLNGQLTEKGRIRAWEIARANKNIDVTKPESWSQIFYLLGASGTLTVEEFIPRLEPVNSLKTPNIDDIENIDLGSRSGRDEAARILMRDMQQGAYEWYQAFHDSLVRDFSHYLTDEQTKSVIEVMKARNLNFCSAKDWGRARRAAIKFGTLPETLRYPSEILDDLIEITPNTYEGRQELKRQERLLRVPSTQVEY